MTTVAPLPFAGLCAFPLTPFARGGVDEPLAARLYSRLVGSADSVGVLGSTGSYMYLTAHERWRLTDCAAEYSGGLPLLVGVSDIALRQVLKHVDAAARAGASGLLLAPVGYQPLTEREVFELYRAVAGSTDVPVIIYDNPGTTHFTFTPELYARLAEIPGVVGVKLPPTALAGDIESCLGQLQGQLPGMGLGISGDAVSLAALGAGIETWYSVLGGTFPALARSLFERAQAGQASELTGQLQPLWDLYAAYGSKRAMVALASEVGLLPADSLPAPLLPLEDTSAVRAALAAMEVTGPVV